MGPTTLGQKGVQGARGDRKREGAKWAKCDGRKGKDTRRGAASCDDKPGPEFWDHYFREENFQGKTLGEFLNDDPPSPGTEQARLAWFEQPHPELFYKEEDLRHFRENGISIGEEEEEGESDYPTNHNGHQNYHHHQYARETGCDDEEGEEHEGDNTRRVSHGVPPTLSRGVGVAAEREAVAAENEEFGGEKENEDPSTTTTTSEAPPKVLSLGAAAFAAASAAYGRSSSTSSTGSISPALPAVAAAAAGFAPKEDRGCSGGKSTTQTGDRVAKRNRQEAESAVLVGGGEQRSRERSGGCSTAAASSSSSSGGSRGLSEKVGGGDGLASKQQQQQQQQREELVAGGKKRRTVVRSNAGAGAGAGGVAKSGVGVSAAATKRRRTAGGGALAPTSSSIGRAVAAAAPSTAPPPLDLKDPMQKRLLEFRQKKKTLPTTTTTPTTTKAPARATRTSAAAAATTRSAKVKTVRSTQKAPVARGHGSNKRIASGRTGAGTVALRAAAPSTSTAAPAVAGGARDAPKASAGGAGDRGVRDAPQLGGGGRGGGGVEMSRGAGGASSGKTVSMPVTTIKRTVRVTATNSSKTPAAAVGVRGSRGSRAGKEEEVKSAGVKRKAPGEAAGTAMVLLSGNVSNVTDRKRRPGAKKGDSKAKANDSSAALSFDEDLKAKLAAHNRGVTKGRHTYEPSKGRVKDWKKWERMTGKKYYSLTPDEKADANKEIADMLAAERDD